MMPVGFGLLKGRSSSRGWAKFWIGGFALVVGGLLFGYPFFGDSYSVRWFGGKPAVGAERHFVTIVFPTVFLLASRWAWHSLTSPKVASFFDDLRSFNAEQAAAPDR